MRRSHILSVFFLASFFCLFILSAAAQNYDEQWKRVESLAWKRRPESALEEVKKIYEQAKANKHDAQVIKSLLYMNYLQNENREKSEILSIAAMEKEISTSADPARSILQNMLAQQYLDHFNRVRWQLYYRTKTENFKSYDIETWSINDFHEKITELFNASIQNEALLQSTSLEQFDPIIIQGNARILRPTLYDLLANRAFEYFEDDERNITKPAYRFDLDLASAFLPAAKFIARFGNAKDSLAFQHPALLILRKLISFHLTDNNPAALIDADINRIQFVWENSTYPEKNRLYLDALQRLADQYGDHPAVMQASYLIAVYYEKQGKNWDPFDDTAHRYDKVIAKEICQKIMQQQRESEGKTHCENLLNRLLLPDISFSIEDVNIPEKPFRVLVKYTNTPVIWLRVVAFNESLPRQRTREDYNNAILGLRAIKEWQQAMPSTEDLQEHSAEIKVDGLPPGKYLLLASTDKNFKRKETTVATHLFHVSNISYVKRGNDIFVLDRDNGQPLVKASVQVWEKGYRRDLPTYEKGYLFLTDSNGYFRLRLKADEAKEPYSVTPVFDIIYKYDKFFLIEDPDRFSYSRYRYNYPRPYYLSSPNEKTKIFLFTDRSIYRPGQTVYFKGIALKKDSTGRSGRTLEDSTMQVHLQNVNDKTISSLTVTTNRFGSFNGFFQLPVSTLNGQFRIFISHELGWVDFQVEEYKRPTFYIEYETVKGAYKLNEAVTVTGTAKAYAGNNIDGARVSYRVVRNMRYLYDWYFWYLPRKWSYEYGIKVGETRTDANGKFSIIFDALPDSTVEKDTDPVFDYTIYTTVTDISGETRYEVSMVSVSYRSLFIASQLGSKMPVDSLYDLHIRTRNMNGGFEQTLLNVTITKLKDENRLIRQRLWNRPDQFTMTKNDYINYFPYDEYDNESAPLKRQPEKIIHEQTGLSSENGSWPLKEFKGKAGPGFYLITMTTKDKDGREIKDLAFIELYDGKINRLSNPAYVHIEAPKMIEPGETTKAVFGTSAENVFLVQLINKGTAYLKPQTQSYSFFQVSNEKKTLELSATEADRGGYGVEWMFVKHNRLYQHGEVINVPWRNKELNIEYASYRDKTLPGSEEKWKLKITGYKNEKLATELLASMYDVSLDQLYMHRWREPFPWSSFYRSGYWETGDNFTKSDGTALVEPEPIIKPFVKMYDDFISPKVSLARKPRNTDGSIEPLWWLNPLDYLYSEERNPRLMRLPKPVYPDSDADGVPDELDMEVTPANCPVDEKGVQLDSDGDGISDCKDTNNDQKEPDVKARTNFSETAFFLPELHTDSTGSVEFSFTMPESLTGWKFQALAHTKELAFGYSSKNIITQKQLMVQPNTPRFLREMDKITLSSKIVNLSDGPLKGEAFLQLVNAETDKPIDSLFKNRMSRIPVSIEPGKSIAVKFPVEIPSSYDGLLKWRILCRTTSGSGEIFSDGEENILPVLPNRELVTESIPVSLRGAGTKNFRFDNLLASAASKTLKHKAITVEYTSNPTWYAIQALPYLMEYPYECAEQTWNRYYANALATYIINSSPRIKEVFDKWKKDSVALRSPLEKNEELKALLLEETPWLRQGNNEAERKRNLSLLFDLYHMNQELNKTYDKLMLKQNSNGAFSWFTGGPDSRYMTQYIVCGIGHLKKLTASDDEQSKKLDKIVSAAMAYLDKAMRKDYEEIKKDKDEKANHLIDYSEIQYLYMRSFFPGIDMTNEVRVAFDYFMKRASNTWQYENKYMQGMTALVLSRNGNLKTASEILLSLKETAIKNDELGMYWKDQSGGWFWYEAPFESQSLLIEAFQEVGKDNKTVDDLRTWLLRNKQANNWKTTKATAEACYALLLQGTDWLNNEPTVEIKLGTTVINSTENKTEEGTGYFKTTIEGNKVTPQMGNISVTVGSSKASPEGEGLGGAVSWGGVYWQYFEDLNKITPASTPLKLTKKLFVEKSTLNGPVLTPINNGDKLKVGDKIKVRVELRVDREMEYVHMKDMRSAGTEPVNVLSGYRWQDGLGYYETTKDASTSFFFDHLRKGTYVFEYPLFVTHAGNFSNGITSIQCMYAPEFTAHSEGIRITVE